MLAIQLENNKLKTPALLLKLPQSKPLKTPSIFDKHDKKKWRKIITAKNVAVDEIKPEKMRE